MNEGYAELVSPKAREGSNEKSGGGIEVRIRRFLNSSKRRTHQTNKMMIKYKY